MSINWSDPAARAALAQRVGPRAYNRLHAAARRAAVVMRVRGREITRESSRFGPLFSVSGEGVAYGTLVNAVNYVLSLPGDSEDLDGLSSSYLAWTTAQKLPDVSADELILHPDLTPDQRAWISAFIIRWEAASSD
jgi:hypothetical protein